MSPVALRPLLCDLNTLVLHRMAASDSALQGRRSTISYYDAQAASFDHIPFGPRLLPDILRANLPTSTNGQVRAEADYDHHEMDGDSDGRAVESSPTGLTALDVGSGPGALAAWLRDELCFTVDCVDPSRAMVERCCAKGLRAHHCLIQDYVPDHEGQTFDVILAVSSLFHIPKDELASNVVPKLRRLLKTGGCLVVSLMLGHDTSGLLDPTNSGIARYFSGVQPGELLGWLGPAFVIRFSTTQRVPAMGHDFWIGVLEQQDGGVGRSEEYDEPV